MKNKWTMRWNVMRQSFEILRVRTGFTPVLVAEVFGINRSEALRRATLFVNSPALLMECDMATTWLGSGDGADDPVDQEVWGRLQKVVRAAAPDSIGPNGRLVGQPTL